MSQAAGNRPVLHVEALRYTWPGAEQPCLDIDQLDVAAGEMVFIYGPSGCGKSTLLSLLAGILVGEHGTVQLLDQAWEAMSAAQRDRHRANHVGYVFQQFNLLPYLNVVDNVLLPCRFSSRRAAAGTRAQAESLLGQMGLASDLWRRPAPQLSVGQQQRVAAARALIGNPELVIADEPTSALDEPRRDDFLNVLQQACRTSGSALVFVSHDRGIQDRFDRCVHLPSINRLLEASR
jgi:putative ABC transport system ATP-binding protein